ncbi:RICIN domain-containing protein [Streptomyces sp. NPDC021093]|uniref:RICIN domain-containing protein n=1 Tax=Streptomyces sp. NPDC021093 TaxID=3365112 RepID=UPI0037A3D5EA
MVARHSGRVLHITVGTDGTRNGAPVRQQEWANADHPKFRLEPPRPNTRHRPGGPAGERTAGAVSMREVDVESNYELIRRIDPYVKSSATSLTSLGEAVRLALASHLPELTPHTKEVTAFMAQYYGVDN